MVSIDRVQRGVSRYLDTELVGKMDGLNKWLFAAAASAYIGSAPALLDKLRGNKLLAPLNLVNEAGEVDVEKIYAHLKPAAAKCRPPQWARCSRHCSPTIRHWSWWAALC